MEIAPDHIAEEYDRKVIYSPIAMLHRRSVWRHLRKTLQLGRPLQVMVLNCGTGEDAVWLARQGHFVLATDDSPLMVRATARKARRLKLNHMIAAKQMAITDLADNHFLHKFDLVYADFGGLNKVPSFVLNDLSAQLASLIRPGGHFVAVVKTPRNIWEMSYHSLGFRFRKAFRQSKREQIFIDLEGRLTSQYRYSPKQIVSKFGRDFDLASLRPVGFFLPPTSLEPVFGGSERFLMMLDYLENSSNHIAGLAPMADHFLLDLELR